MTILVTGASGFIGTGLMARLSAEKRSVRGASRKPVRGLDGPTSWIAVEDQDDSTDWRGPLEGVGTVVHLAGRAHIMRDRTADPLGAFRRTNVYGTLNLARQAASAGVGRFVFVSSIKVNGETGTHRESDTPAPSDAYGSSKLEAENGLWEVAATTGLGVVVIRPPLVYGPGAKGNFEALVRAVRRGIPLPFGAIENRRSLVGRDNLVDFVVTCIEHPRATGGTFYVSDGEDLSTPTLVRRIARAMRRPARLFPVPASVLWAAASVTGKRALAQRLLGSLQLDITRARTVLEWSPPLTVDESLRRAVGERVSAGS